MARLRPITIDPFIAKVPIRPLKVTNVATIDRFIPGPEGELTQVSREKRNNMYGVLAQGA